MLPRLIWHHDLPLNFANSVHIFAVSELARQHVTVVLTGEGADELFGGYPRYSIPRITELLSSAPGATAPAAGSVAGAHCRIIGCGELARCCAGRWTTRCSSTARASTQHRSSDCWDGRWATRRLTVRRQLVAAARQAHSNVYGAVAQLDFETYLVSILNRQDKMSMATSLEARVPFLDNEVIDLARSLPQQFKQTLRHRKRVLKDVARRYLPREIVDRRKSGFGVPLPEWFRGTGPMSELLDETASSAGLD